MIIRPSAAVSIEAIAGRILVIRGQRVMLDVDIAALYGVPTGRLNEQVKRNKGRFPADFAFTLNREEWAVLMLSQIATTSQRRRRLDRLPRAFTEHGCLMLANVLRSTRAIEVSLLVVRAFVHLRRVLDANKDLAARVDELARELGLHRRKLTVHDQTILRLLGEIRRLTRFPESKPRPIGFTANLNSDKS